MLLIANLHDIRCTSLSGSASRLPSIPTKQTVAMDFIYAEETVCWIDVGETPATTHLKCANIPDLKNVVNIRTINISLSLHRECPALLSLSPWSFQSKSPKVSSYSASSVTSVTNLVQLLLPATQKAARGSNCEFSRCFFFLSLLTAGFRENLAEHCDTQRFTTSWQVEPNKKRLGAVSWLGQAATNQIELIGFFTMATLLYKCFH